MTKFFLFAAAIVAAMSVNAKVVKFAGIVNKTAEDAALSSFNAAFGYSNVTLATAQTSSEAAPWYVLVKQTAATEEWDVTTLYLKADDQVYFSFKDTHDDKDVAKVLAEYFQPAGKAVALTITGLNSGDEVTINLKEALDKEVALEGASVESKSFNATAVKLTAAESTIRVFSKTLDNADAKWKLVSVEVPGTQGIENSNASVKIEKFYRDGQLVIRKNGVEYNVLGAQL